MSDIRVLRCWKLGCIDNNLKSQPEKFGEYMDFIRNKIQLYFTLRLMILIWSNNAKFPMNFLLIFSQYIITIAQMSYPLCHLPPTLYPSFFSVSQYFKYPKNSDHLNMFDLLKILAFIFYFYYLFLTYFVPNLISVMFQQTYRRRQKLFLFLK